MRHVVSLIIFSISLSSWGASSLDREVYRDIRLLGRGNTGVSSVSNASALFYNPAGVALENHFALNLLNPFLGTSQSVYDSVKELSNIQSDDDSLLTKFKPFLGKHLSLEYGFFPSLQLPFFAAGYFSSGYAQMSYRNPVNPELSARYRSDDGFIGGVAFPFYQRFFLGVSLKYLYRSTAVADLNGGVLLQSSETVFKNITKKGEGFGLNVGFIHRVPVSSLHVFQWGMAVEDLGVTQLRNNRKPEKRPDPQPMMMNLGTSLEHDSDWVGWKLLADYRQLNKKDVSRLKKIHLGAELSFLRTDFRGGFYQGYWTAGLTFRGLPFFDLDFTTYAEELDSIPGLRYNRVYLVGLHMGMDLGGGSSQSRRSRQRLSLDDIP